METSKIQQIAKCSKNIAINIKYSLGLNCTGLLYTNRGNYADSTKRWFEKNFDVTFERGNNSPKWGKNGEFIKIVESTEKLKSFVELLQNEEQKILTETAEREEKKNKALELMVISDEEKNKFIAKTAGTSNKRKRQIAHNFAGRKLGFYSTEGMKKYFELTN